MENLKKQYKENIETRKKLQAEIKTLASYEAVKRIFKLMQEDQELEKEQKKLYRDLKFTEYSTCNHIWVISLHDYDPCEGRSYNYYGCIKCGLNGKMFWLKDNLYKPEFFTPEEKIMYDYLTKYGYGKGITEDIVCDLELGKAIYAKIKAAQPDIDDKTALEYFKIALHDMQNNKNGEERKEGYARKLIIPE